MTASNAISSDQNFELLCPACDYPLRGLLTNRCPECGTLFDRAALDVSQIPWVHRGQMGVARAFLRTVRMATAHPGRIAVEVARPVSLSDAKRFRHLVVLLAYLPLLEFGIWVAADSNARIPILRNIHGHVAGWVLEAGGLLVAAFSLWLFLFAATWAASFFFHPSAISIERQNRAIALSNYACAPLAMMPVSGLAFLLLALPKRYAPQIGDGLAMVAGTFLIIVVLLLPPIAVASWYGTTLILLRRTTHCSVARTLAAALCLPCLWISLFVLIAVGIPAVYVYVSLMILSFA